MDNINELEAILVARLSVSLACRFIMIVFDVLVLDLDATALFLREINLLLFLSATSLLSYDRPQKCAVIYGVGGTEEYWEEVGNGSAGVITSVLGIWSLLR